MLRAQYIAAGGNRHPSAADWISTTTTTADIGGDGDDADIGDEILAFGSGRNIALWRGRGLDEGTERGVETLLIGHTDTVNAIKFLRVPAGLLIISGSVDKSVRVWHQKDQSPVTKDRNLDYECVQVLGEHQSSINCIAVASGVDIFVTGSADATVKIWKVGSTVEDCSIQLLQSIHLVPRYFPLALALSPLTDESNSFLLAVAGTAVTVQLYVADASPNKTLEFTLRATLSGHEGWIRSLSFTHENNSPDSDLLLASASQDKYIRLWRIHQGKELPAVAAAGADPALGAFLPGKSLSNKAHRFRTAGKDYSATFEALLLGHEDWIYSAVWKSKGNTLQLLSASADNSLSIWEQDPASSVWISVARLGEISAQKGSTTATGSTGGFWTGLWSPNGRTVACVGRTGSWRRWNYDGEQDRWVQGVGISGHTQAVTGVAWSRNGDYLLSTSSDQTTRLHAKWINNGHSSWHEMARPQIHGYDLNCIDTLGEVQFVSGADEKLLRVFTEPKAVADLLHNLCGISNQETQSLPDAANIPVLGLSNKATSAFSPEADASDPSTTADSAAENIDPTTLSLPLPLSPSHPPLEDHLSKHTLWPEVEKLYGHGYEISALAASHDGGLVATACRASSLEHAVIRLFETAAWTEVRPPLTAHALTVTRLRFSRDDRYLLSVGRDRQWAVFERGGGDGSAADGVSGRGSGVGAGGARRTTARGGTTVHYSPVEINPKAHSRMILDAAWAPLTSRLGGGGGGGGGGGRCGRAFATAGRDKSVKLWGRERHGDGDTGGGKRDGAAAEEEEEEEGEEEEEEEEGKFVCKSTIVEESPVTAVDFIDTGAAVSLNGGDGGSSSSTITAYLALAMETGRLSVCRVDVATLVVLEKFVMGVSSCPSRAITQLAWRPSSSQLRRYHRGRRGEVNGTTGRITDDEEVLETEDDKETELAVASEDCSLRIYTLKALLAAAAATSI